MTKSKIKDTLRTGKKEKIISILNSRWKKRLEGEEIERTMEIARDIFGEHVT